MFRYLKVPIVIAGLMVVVSGYLVLAPIIDKPDLEYLYCTIFIFSGLLLYYPFIHRKVNWAHKLMSMFTVFLSKSSQVIEIFLLVLDYQYRINGNNVLKR